MKKSDKELWVTGVACGIAMSLFFGILGMCSYPTIAQPTDPDTPFLPYMVLEVHHEVPLWVVDEPISDEEEIEKTIISGVCIKNVKITNHSNFHSFCKTPETTTIIPRNDSEAETIYMPPGCHMIRMTLDKYGQADRIYHYHDKECYFQFNNQSPMPGEIPDQEV